MSERMNDVYELMHRLDPEPDHAQQVCKLAIKLFNELQDLHGLREPERELLFAASLLHDIGWSVGGSRHHKSSMRLIMESKLPGWRGEEKIIIANIARYHRKAMPKISHKNFAILADDARVTVVKLSALLRVADGLDRSHRNAVENFECNLDIKQVELILYCRNDIGMEIYGFEKKRDLFQKEFKKNILIKDVIRPYISDFK